MRVLLDEMGDETFEGRTGCVSAQHPRHLRGCYLTRDRVYSETAPLRLRANTGEP
jgi:hypothetical protein